MRIAFTGKGGSGKSTVGSLFIEYLLGASQRVLAIDADINVHLAGLLGVEVDSKLALSNPDTVTAVRRHLMGQNPLIPGVEHMVKTTQPGPGSNLLRIDREDPVVGRYATRVGDDLFLMQVGTYESRHIGVGCYHASLAILENLLSHTVAEDDWIVCDMVAGTDAFACTLHAQFDAIVVVVEPTPESVSVACRYRELAASAGVADVLALVGNKVCDLDDVDYLRLHLGVSPLASLPTCAGLRRARQSGARPSLAHLADTTPLKEIEAYTRDSPMTAGRRSDLLRALHLRLAEQSWIVNAHGDVSGQLHPNAREAAACQTPGRKP